MLEIIIIICLLLVLLITVQYKKNKKDKKNSFNQKLSKKLANNNIKVIKNINKPLKKQKNYNYYSKKKVRFADKPTYYDCPVEKNLSEQDKFLDEYVFNNRIFCKNKSQKSEDTSLAEYRRDVFDFREKTNQIANNYSPVDRINEMILNNPDLSGMKISNIYDGLTSNEFNTNYTSINMPTSDNNIDYITNDNNNSSYAGYKSNIY